MDLADDFIAATGPINELLGLADLVQCQVGDVTDTGLPDHSFDLVWSQNVLMNVEDKAAALGEAYRLLAPGGSFVLQAVVQDARGIGSTPCPGRRVLRLTSSCRPAISSKWLQTPGSRSPAGKRPTACRHCRPLPLTPV